MEIKHVRPKLLDCVVHTNGSKLVLEQTSTRKQLVLPLERKQLLELFDGSNSIEAIVAELYSSNEFKFRTILMTLELLQDEGFIEELPVKIRLGDKVKSLHDSRATFLERGLFEIPLGGGWAWKLRNEFLFFLTAIVVVGLGIYASVFAFMKLETSFFLRTNDEYLYAIPTLFLICSALLSIKNITRMKLLGFLTGKIYRPTISVSGYALYFSVSNNSLYLSGNRTAILFYSFASIFMYLAPITILLLLFPHWPYLNDTFLIASLLTLADLNPYRKSEFTRLLHLLFSEEVQGRMLSYLRNRAVLTLSPLTRSIKDEGKYFVYSVFALCWTLGFLLVALEFISKNLPNLILGVSSPSSGFASQMQAAVVLILLVSILVYLGWDLLRTVGQNLFYPFASAIYRMQSGGGAGATYSENQLIEKMSAITFFQNISDTSKKFLAGNGTTARFSNGRRIIVQGDISQEVFVLLSGKVKVVHREDSGLELVLAELNAPAIFGEMAILNRAPRSADVVASGDADLLKIPNAVFEGMLQGTEMKGDHAQILRQIHISRVLSQAPLLRKVPAETIGIITGRTEVIDVEAGKELTREGASDRSFFLLLKGEVSVERGGKEINTLSEGGFFGEVALISQSPRIATVRTKVPCEVAKLEADAFWDLLMGDLNLATAIEAVAEERLDASLWS